MTGATRVAALALAALAATACTTAPREPIPITPPGEVAAAPVARVAVPAPGAPQAPATPAAKLDPSSIPAGAIYVCSSGSGGARKITAIAFDEKAGKLCRRHPEMGPCQYERNLCRRSGGRVYAADGTEITMATEAEYDRKVMRVRFQAK